MAVGDIISAEEFQKRMQAESPDQSGTASSSTDKGVSASTFNSPQFQALHTAPAPSLAGQNQGQTQAPKTGIFAKLLGDVSQKRGQQFMEAVDLPMGGKTATGVNDPYHNLPRKAEKATRAILGGATDIVQKPMGEAMQFGAKIAIPNVISGLTGIPPEMQKQAATKMMQSPAGQNIITNLTDTASKISSSVDQFKKEHPELSDHVGFILDILNFWATASGIEGGIKSVFTKEGSARLGGAVNTVKGMAGDVKQVAEGAMERHPINVATKQAEREAVAALPPQGQKAVRAGLEIKDIQLINESRAKPQQFGKMKEMAKAAAEYSTSRSAKDPAQIVGEELQSRVFGISKLQKETGQALGEAVKDLPKTAANTGQAKNAVLERLKNAVPGIKTTIKKGKVVMDFSDTSLAGPKNAAARRAIMEEFSAINNKSPLQLHRQRQGLFEYLGGKSKAGIATIESEDKGLQAIREGLADYLSSVSDPYKQLNQKYAQYSEMLKDMRGYLKGTEGADTDIAQMKAGAIARRLTNYTESGPVIRQTLRDMETALKAAGQPVTTDIGQLQDFYNTLSRYYDITKDTSLAGQMKLGTQDLTIKGLIGRGADAATKSLQVTKSTQQKALWDLLSGSENAPPVSVPLPKGEAPFTSN